MQIQWDVIGTQAPERKEETWTEGVHHAKVEAVTETEHSDGRKIILVRSRVVAPEKAKGQSIFDRFWVGTKDDLLAEKPETWASNYAAVRLKDFASCFNVEPDADSEVFAAQIKDQEFLPYIEPRVYTKKDGKPGVSADVKGYYKLGSRSIGTTNGKPEETTPVPQPPKFVIEAE